VSALLKMLHKTKEQFIANLNEWDVWSKYITLSFLYQY